MLTVGAFAPDDVDTGLECAHHGVQDLGWVLSIGGENPDVCSLGSGESAAYGCVGPTFFKSWMTSPGRSPSSAALASSNVASVDPSLTTMTLTEPLSCSCWMTVSRKRWSVDPMTPSSLKAGITTVRLGGPWALLSRVGFYGHRSRPMSPHHTNCGWT